MQVARLHDVPLRTRPRILIVGGGFAGLAVAGALRGADADVVIIDRRNHTLFQPLLYQVATATISPSEIAAPIRQLVETQENVEVVLAEVTKVDLQSRTLDAHNADLGTRTLSFDYLVIATGVQSSYFGHEEFAQYAPSLKTLTDAQDIRTRVLRAFELAELSDDPAEQARLMTFAIVGGGPTGVELAASLATMATQTLQNNFRRIDPSKSSIILIEGGKRILPAFHESLAEAAARRLERLGVQMLIGSNVKLVDADGVVVGAERINSATVLWAAGVAPSPILKKLGVPTDRSGRVHVSPSLEVPGFPGVFVIGDAASIMQDGYPLPGVAQVAIQSGGYAGHAIANDIAGRTNVKPFRYINKGNLAVVGKNYAVFERDKLRLSGFIAWLVWAFIHIMFLPQLQNRLRVEIQWLWTYFTAQRGSRIIPESHSEQRSNNLEKAS